MNPYMWLRVFLFFAKVDVKSFRSRISIKISKLELWYKKTKYRKIYEEKNLFFVIIFFPSIILRRWENQRIADSLGVTLEQLYEEQISKIVAENELRRQDIQKLKLKNMKDLAGLFSGATIHDYNFLEKQPILSFRFVLTGVRNLFSK